MMRPDAAPESCKYYTKAINEMGAFSTGKATFYRSDFVIQCGLYPNPPPASLGNLPVNETASGTKISNTRGTAAIAHFDVPDNGNTEFFINLKANDHLDTVYGGYCVFAKVADQASFATVDKIAAAVTKGNVKISAMVVE